MSDTDTTTQAPAGTDQELPHVAGWDWDEDYCSEDPGTVAEELCPQVIPPVAARLGELFDSAQDTHAVHDALQAYATELRTLTDDETDLGEYTIEDYEKAIDLIEEHNARLTFCQECQCAWEAWHAWGRGLIQEVMDAADQSTSNMWAVTANSVHRGDGTVNDLEGVDDLDVLIASAGYGDRCTWSELEVTWDGRTLTVKVLGGGGGTTLVCTPLSEAQQELYDRWIEYDPYNEELASQVLKADQATLARALDLQDTLWEVSADTFSIPDLLHALDQLDPATRDSLDTGLVTSLAEHWTGTLEDLLASAAALTVTTPAPTA
jgi:hypothetical protein